ncbi:ADP-ribosylglycohydrolase family protein [Zavarzinia sp. CC-PAN008]|uniref:ADP-ribosylglycohydrolase family protein n=1 Tax=Zavarzinia sp. CC-PAN008 TaxID=3243332 RepID=UPI003F7482BD
MRTSLSHPLEIAAVQAPGGRGRIGITFCPGKKQPGALTGAWDRDLGLDLDAVRDWGAAAVLTLVEPAELVELGVPGLGAAVAARHMAWTHLPIPDVTAPGPRFEVAWQDAGEGVRALLRDGFDIVVHCKGGRGRAGTVAARLLVELGMDPAEAIIAVRQARQGAIETPAQERHVLASTRVAERPRDHGTAATADRAAGALLGLAVGDAVGTTLEFKPRDTYPPLTDMVGGGPFGLQPGQWTDDTAMALALGDSLLHAPMLDEADLMRRFTDWWQRGAYSCTGSCFDIGNTVSTALARWARTGDPVAGATAANTAGNGSLMRLAPVVLRHWRDRDTLRDVAARQSRTTHGAAEAVDACVAYADILADAIAGESRSHVLRNSDPSGLSPATTAILAGSWRGKGRGAVRGSGYVSHSLEAALWSIGRTTDFRSAVLTAANLGEDADTTAAIAGQLAGALYGTSGIPADWLEQLAWRDRIEAMATRLFTTT